MEKLLTMEEAAEILNLRVRTIRFYISRGVIPVMRVGKHYRFSEKRLHEWLMDKEIKTQITVK